ncbi:MAG TPA: alpha-N-arabinofuranosidase [Candidatus Eisenbacteria bacterium]|nr:alpha-N-arabinofuranosidase [Candidatus Eisenbacteria bacterium]
MTRESRRGFLQKAAVTGIGLSADKLFAPILKAQSKATVASAGFQVYLDTRRTLPSLDRNIFGSFLEHLGRAIYEGIYEPQSKLSDSNGFRKDVLEEIRKLSVPIVRYPGGNFVSGYHWLDGVGPKSERPTVLDKAWNTIDTNQFGTNEFLAWCKDVGTEPLLAVNLGTGTPESAAALVEYCNVAQGTKWSDLRRKHGIAEPYHVTHWCLGNEMDGPWQIGHMSSAEYGEKAADAARQMRDVDPSLKLVACGSSGPMMPTYLQWDREVLEQCFDYVDAISLHRYFDNTTETGGDSARFLALNLSMESQIAEVAAVCDYVQARRKSAKQLWLSFDEWNVWYRARSGSAMNGDKKVAPHLLEEIYNLEDALLVGGLINSLLRNSNRVRLACLAQLVNVIAPIMTNENGLYRQTIYYPYSWALQYARGAAMEVLTEPGPSYEVPNFGKVPYLDVAATFDAEHGIVSVFALNRDLSNSHQVTLNWESQAASRLLAGQVLTGDDLKAVNGFDKPDRIAPRAAEKPSIAGSATRLELPPRSYSCYQWAI